MKVVKYQMFGETGGVKTPVQVIASYNEAALADAKKYAINGDYTVEEVKDF